MNLQIISNHPNSNPNRSWIKPLVKLFFVIIVHFSIFFTCISVLQDSKLPDYIIILPEFFSAKKISVIDINIDLSNIDIVEL